MKLVCQYMVIFFIFLLTSNLLQPLQVENCDGNSRLVVDEDDNGKIRLERVKSRTVTPDGVACRTSSFTPVIFPDPIPRPHPSSVKHRNPMVDQCWASVVDDDAGPALAQHWDDVSCLLGRTLALSSSLWPWIDVFALPEKFNMAVTESDTDPKVRKMSITF